MGAAVRAAREAIDQAGGSASLGVYANAFAPEPPSEMPYVGVSDIRADLDPENYLKWIERWRGAGASAIGGSCGIGLEHVDAIRTFRLAREAA